MGDEVVVNRDARINGDCAAVGAHWHARHALNAAGDIAVACAAADLIGRDVYGLKTRGAEAVDRETRDAFIEIGGENGCTGKACALFCNLCDIAPDNVFNGVAFEAIALFEGVERHGGETRGRDFMQAAVFAAFATGGAHSVIDIGFGHGVTPVFRKNLGAVSGAAGHEIVGVFEPRCVFDVGKPAVDIGPVGAHKAERLWIKQIAAV